MFCSHCGSPVDVSTNYCRSCGQRLIQQGSTVSPPAAVPPPPLPGLQATERRATSKWSRYVLFGLGAILTIMVVGIMTAPRSNSTGDDKGATSTAPSQKSVAAKDAKALEAALKTVSVSKDPAEQLEFYYPKPRPGGIYAYIGRSTTDRQKYMRLNVRSYAGEVFLASEVTFLIDGSTETISVNPFKEAGVDPNPEGDGAVFADTNVENQLLRNIVAAKEVYVSLKSDATGKRTSFRMTKTQQASLKHMLSVYDLM